MKIIFAVLFASLCFGAWVIAMLSEIGTPVDRLCLLILIMIYARITLD